MCGIVGIISQENSKDFILDGLGKLEYRGYDSSGIAGINSNGEQNIIKDVVRINELTKMSEGVELLIGIGHTRWATHGKPEQCNAHPHQSYTKRFTLVHNGVIENEQEIAKKYLQDVKLSGQTDSEKVVHLLDKLMQEEDDMLSALDKLREILEGSYALAIIDAKNPQQLYGMKNKSPMLIGIGQGFNALGSDAMALVSKTTELKEIKDGEIVVLNCEEVKIFDNELNVVKRDSFTSSVNSDDIELGTYDYYMMKEINEQPMVIRTLIGEYVVDGKYNVNKEIIEQISIANQIHIIAAGTSMHAGLVGKQYLENIVGKPTQVHIASEFVYNMPLVSKDDLFIFVSQSGETADLRSALLKVKEMGGYALTVTNVPESTLDREANAALYLHAGPEIAVASTKAYIAQTTMFYILANAVMNNDVVELNRELSKLATVIETICEKHKDIEELTKQYLSTARNAFFIGRGLDYYGSMEAALKLKEISYIQAEGFAAGELKHGTIALIEDGVPVIALDSDVKYQPMTRSNVEEVKARGANTLVITTNPIGGNEFIIDNVNENLNTLSSVVVTQFISYYAAMHRGLDIDKPRNLAKSVTVE